MSTACRPATGLASGDIECCLKMRIQNIQQSVRKYTKKKEDHDYGSNVRGLTSNTLDRYIPNPFGEGVVSEELDLEGRPAMFATVR